MFQVTVLKFVDLLGGLKLAINENFQQNIYKITPAIPKKNTGTWGVGTTL